MSTITYAVTYCPDGKVRCDQGVYDTKLAAYSVANGENRRRWRMLVEKRIDGKAVLRPSVFVVFHRDLDWCTSGGDLLGIFDSLDKADEEASLARKNISERWVEEWELQ